MAAEHLIDANNIADDTSAQDDFQSFGTSPLFQTDPATTMHVPVALAHAWTEAIIRFCESGLTTGRIDPAEPLYLLDMAPAHGHLAWLMLPTLAQQLAAICPDLKPCFVACGQSRSALQSIASHPWLREYVEEGWLDTALWNENAPGAFALQSRGTTVTRTRNPVVMLCAEWLHTLRTDLFAAHHAQLLEGVVAADPIPQQANTWALRYDWQPTQAGCESPLLAHYKKRFSSASLLIPTGAFAAIDRLAHVSGNRYLLLSCDAGVCSERQIRAGMTSPPAQWLSDVDRLPVNYHALSWHQQQSGACTWNCQLADDGLVMHASVRDDDGKWSQQILDHVCDALHDTHPDDRRVIADPQVHVSAELTLSMLRLSRYDPQVLRAGLTALLECPPALNESALHEWHHALARTVENYLPPSQQDPFLFDVGLLALHFDRWGLARDCFRSMLVYGDDALTLHHLAYCEMHTGRLPIAEAILAHALTMTPEHPHCRALADQASRRRASWQQYGWQPADEESELALEPLGIEHASRLLYQYRDPQIGIMTRLPELDTLEDAQQWIAEQQQENGRLCYAVMHADHGFVGIVSLRRAGDAGYFYFWIGADFQDAGFGRAAATLLFEQARRLGLQQIFTSAYDDNTRSVAALRHLGFERLAIRAQEPDDDLIFFRLGLNLFEKSHDDADACCDLQKLCLAIDSVFTFTRPSVKSSEG